MDSKPERPERVGAVASPSPPVAANEREPYHWSRDVQVPLRGCDYGLPLIVRSYPFHLDRTEEEELPLDGAGRLMLSVPYWRRFKLWRDRRPPAEAYLVMKQTLLRFGYSDQDVTPLAFDEAVRLLEEELCRKESEDLRRDMGGVWPSDFRKCLWEAVGVWITQPKVLEYWRQQVRTMCGKWEQYHARKDIVCPDRFGGRDCRPLCLPDDLPAIYTAVAQLHDRFSVTQIATKDLTQIPWHVGGRDRSWPIPRLFPGADMVRWGHDAQVVDLDIVRRFIEEIHRDLVAHALLSENPANKPEKPGETLAGAGDTKGQSGEMLGDAGATKWVKIGETKSEGSEEEEWEIRPKKASIEDRFTFKPGQALFDGKDLGLSTGFTIEVFRKLVDGFGGTVPYATLDANCKKEASEQLRKAKRAIVVSLEKHRVPCGVVPKPREGYCLCEKAGRDKTRKTSTSTRRVTRKTSHK